jgi:hypothetical protein
MPTVRELNQPKRFIHSALANVDSAHWFMWEHGVCVGYWDDSETTHSICCWWIALNRGFVLQTESIRQVRVFGHQVVILSAEGFCIWDGQRDTHVLDTPLLQWNNVEIAPWGGTGFTQFGYHKWTLENNETQRLPMGVQKIWHLGTPESVLWSHWGQFFIHKEGVTRPLEPLKDTMEQWYDLGDWLVAVYDTILVAQHPTSSTLRFENPDIMDVTMRADKSGVLILLATGSVLEWRPQEDPVPVEISEVEGDRFVGEDLIFCDGELEQLFGEMNNPL